MLNQVEFSNRIVESSFSTWFKLLSSTSQFNSTLFQKKFNLTRCNQFTFICFIFYLLAFEAEFSLLNSFLLRSRLNILSFFHEETDDMRWANDVLATKWAAEIADALTTDQLFNLISLTLTYMQISANSFKFMIHSLSITCWRSELILCYKLFSKVLLLYFNSALNLWNFI